MNSPQTNMSKIKDTQWQKTIETRLLTLFNGLDGFGQILFFWGLMCTLLAGVALILIALCQASYWILLAGIATLRCHLYLVRIGQTLLDNIIPYNG